MARIPLLDQRGNLSEGQQAVFDWIVESRGKMIRPFEVLLHVPEMARPAAELGHQIRYEGSLSDHDRELAIISAAKAHRSDFEWESHIGLARAAGVSEEAIAALRAGTEVAPPDGVIVGFVFELCRDSTVSDATWSSAHDRRGLAGVVELSTLVGYYTLLAFVMNAAQAG